MKPKKKSLLLVASFILIIDWIGQYLGFFYDFGMVNRGVSLGMFQNVSSWLILAVWLYLLSRRDSRLNLILIGGFGNLVPRLLFGGVWDYLPMYFFWVNISDLMITAGLVIYLYGLPRSSQTTSQ